MTTFCVGDYIRIKYPNRALWDYNRFHNPATEGNRFLVTDVRSNGDFKIAGFRGFTAWWSDNIFELDMPIEAQIARRIKKLYGKCKTTAHWSK